MSNGRIIGRFNPQTVKLKPEYFLERGIFLDCRGELYISHTANFGWECAIYTASHDISDGIFGKVLLRKVVIGEGAWIASRAILYACTIEAHAVVAAGSVVRGMTVPAYHMVEGNPARIIKRFVNGRWEEV